MASGPMQNTWNTTYYTPSRGTKVSSAETTIYKVGNIVIGFIIASISATMSSSNEVIVTGLPGAKNVMQLPLICVSGTNAGKTGRCRIETNGSILTWFTPFAPVSGEVYLIPVHYICN